MIQTPIATDPAQYALQSMQAQKVRADTASSNTSRASTDGALRQTHDVESTTTGVIAQNAKVYLNPVTVKKLQTVNGQHAYDKTMKTVYETFMQQFGTKENIQSIDHRIQNICDEVLKLSNDTSTTQKQALIKSLIKELDGFRDIQKTITDLRQDIDQAKSTIVNDEIPALLQTLADNNVYDKDVWNLENINTAQFQLSQKIGPVIFDEGKTLDKGYFTVKVGSVKLLDENFISFPTYQSTPNLTPGVDLQPAMVPNNAPGGVLTSLDDAVSGGELGGLNYANRELMTIQANLDQFAYQLMEQINELHNLGTGTQATASITGSVGYWGVEGTALTGAEVLSGQGTLRIGLVDPTQNGVLVDYVDIPMQANESLANLITRINAGAYAHATGNTVLASIDANGALNIRCAGGNPNTNLTVSIGSVGVDPAMICPGNTFDASQAKNFSHFFHMNDLITTSMDATRSTFGDGVFSLLNVRSDLITNVDGLAGCRLNYDAAPAVGDYGVVGFASIDRNIFQQLYASFSSNRTINAIGDIPAQKMTLFNYGVQFTKVYNDKTIAILSDEQSSNTLLQQTRLTFQQESGIDTEDERLLIVELARSREALLSVITAQYKMEDTTQRVLLGMGG